MCQEPSDDVQHTVTLTAAVGKLAGCVCSYFPTDIQSGLYIGLSPKHSLWFDLQDDAATGLLMGEVEDSLSVEDDELDRHASMLPLIHLVEKAAALFSVQSHKRHWQRLFPVAGQHPKPLAIALFLVSQKTLAKPCSWYSQQEDLGQALSWFSQQKTLAKHFSRYSQQKTLAEPFSWRSQQKALAKPGWYSLQCTCITCGTPDHELSCSSRPLMHQQLSFITYSSACKGFANTAV